MFDLRPHLLNGAQRAGDLTEAFGISRGTLLNAYVREAPHILRLGRARATRYAARKNLASYITCYPCARSKLLTM